MTYKFENIYINEKYTLLTSNFNNPLVINSVDKYINDYYMNMKSIEEAESIYQDITINGILKKSKLLCSDISILINSDLQNQLLASSLCNSKYNISSLNIYSACASLIEGFIIASKFVQENDKVIVTVSSHNLVSEKQFRFPVEYGAVRKKVNGCTASGSVSVLISKNRSNIRIESGTIGKIVCTNHNDANDMGSAMAPSCTKVINNHLKDTGRNESYYDLILTGDLGEYGIKIMKEYYKKAYKRTLKNVIDSGNIFYKENSIYCGSSGPICIGLILFDYILKKNKYKKILVVGTGSLHSVISSNLKLPMPSVSHAVSLEII